MLNINTGPYLEPMPESPALVFPYEPDHFQKHAFSAIEQGHNVLVTAHTGSGKTSVADYAVARAVRDGHKVIYTSPIKALSNQIYSDLTKKYDWDVGIKTGDIDLKSDSQVVVMTTEILRNYLFKQELPGVSVVIFDEVHYIKDKDRGSVWEESIIMMPKDVQMVLLSATLPDAEEFCNWVISCTGRDMTYCTTERRVVPLTHYLMTGPTSKVKILDNEGTFYASEYTRAASEYRFSPTELNTYLAAGGIDLPAIFFCFSRNKCEYYARGICTPLIDSGEMSAIDRDFNQLIRKFDPSYSCTRQAQEIRQLLLKGVAYHHAGLLPALKEIVQELFTRGMVKVLFVTETFAAGVNAPAKTVVFTGLTKFDGYANDFRPLYTEEYRQMAGRAGRRGLDTVGHVIHLPFKKDDLLPLHEIKPMLTGKLRNIVSNFKIDYMYILKSISNGQSPEKYLQQSLLRRQSGGQADAIKANITAMEQQLTALQAKYDAYTPRTLSRCEISWAYKCKRLNQKDARIYHNNSKAEEWDKDRELKEALLLRDKIAKLEKDIENEVSSSDSLEYGIYSEIECRIEELKQDGYLDSEGEITKTGLAFIEINEADPEILIPAICDGLFDNKTDIETIVLLSLFSSDKDKDHDPDAAPNSTADYVYTLCTPLVQYADRMSKVVSREYCLPIYAWITHNALDESVSEGEFVKAGLKLVNICKEVSVAAEKLDRLDICKNLQDATAMLVHGIVTPQSLYI
jgi:superfamily II RNA helicase